MNAVQVITSALVAILLLGTLVNAIRGNPMNQAEQDAFDALGKKIDASIAAHQETNAALATSQAALAIANAEIVTLQAQLAAVPPPVDDSPAVLAAIAADSAKLDAENPVAPIAAAPVVAPPVASADPSAAPAS